MAATGALAEPLLASGGGLGQQQGPQRRSGGGHGARAPGQSHEDLVRSLLAASSLRPPTALVECASRCRPALEFLAALLRAAAPVVFLFCKIVYHLYLITPANELRLLYGLALCFFGGEFCASIAAVECFRRTGGDKLLMCVNDISANVRLVQEASLQDDQDQLARGQKSNTQEWCRRKVGVALKAVEPDVLAQAFAGLYQGFLGMMMSLKFQFAWTVALACSIADILRKPAAFLVAPCLAALMPKDYHKWINQIINFTLKALAVHFAWKMQMAVSAVQSGLLGASMVGTSVVVLMYKGCSWSTCGRCCKNKKFDPDKSLLTEFIGLPLAIAGIWFQISHGFSLPFPYSLVLLPLTIVEALLRFCITWFPVQEVALPLRR
mmetsp:Transcript_107725/g.300190  ORF Transcript_107725/g.300190 Transcript_107725/m.300190 type:complete len:380 (+) Transcript_107725:68-1207(+)